MIYEYYKYKDVSSFINHHNKKGSIIQYSLPYGNCKGLSYQNSDFSFNNKCFYCNFCAFGQISDMYSQIYSNKGISLYTFFNGSLATLPNAILLLGNKLGNLEQFTSTDERNNIQLWVAALFSNTCKPPCNVSMEIPADNPLFKRNGRIDVGTYNNSFSLMIETKTTLEDAMKDERFVEQHSKYAPCIEKSLSKDQYLLAIAFGGKETDLLPETHPQCTSTIGGRSSHFYQLIIKYKIPFISAAAIWGLACMHINDPSFYSDDFLQCVFSDPNCIGLLSAGKVCYENGRVTIKSIDL